MPPDAEARDADPGVTDPHEAAEDAVDGDRLLDGEDPTTTYAEDAELWRSVYAELVAFKGDIIARIEDQVDRMHAEAVREVRATDLPVMRAEADRLRRRLRFWTDRADVLRGGRG